jgi:hypothetical protein
MKHWRRRRSDIRHERTVASALERSQADVSGITLKVLGSTGVASPQDRTAIISCVLADADIGQLVDSMAYPGDRPTVNIHLEKERQEPRREMREFCCRRSAWDACFGSVVRAADQPEDLGRAPGRIVLARAAVYARLSARRLLSYLRL